MEMTLEEKAKLVGVDKDSEDYTKERIEALLDELYPEPDPDDPFEPTWEEDQEYDEWLVRRHNKECIGHERSEQMGCQACEALGEQCDKCALKQIDEENTCSCGGKAGPSQVEEHGDVACGPEVCVRRCNKCGEILHYWV